ncbi:MAG: response regulator, partial [Terracidiphilus sp.]
TSLFGLLPTGSWEESPSSALLVPIASQAQDRPAGVFIAALNPYRPLDSGYRGFVELVSGQIAGSLANARAYEQERKRAESLAELDRAKTTFFSNVSHEFRTPLTLMLGPLEEVLAKPEMQVLTDNRRLVGVAHRNGTRLLKLVNTLLDFSRIEAGRVKAVYRPIDLAGFTKELASSFESLTQKAGLELRIHCEKLTRPVYVDREMWEKIVLNLLSNAFKFTFDGEIVISLRESSRDVELAVVDTGVGIPEVELPNVFERFHRVEGTRGRSFEGSGIGLALVHELVMLHGGTIAVESTVGRGTTFRIHIPLGSGHLPQDRVSQAAIESAHGPAVSPYVTEALSWLGKESHLASDVQLSHQPVQTDSVDRAADGKTVLVVDDNSDMREYVARLLRGHFHVRTAENGRVAWETLERDHPDIVLIDIMMPEMDGLELLAAIRGNPTLRITPVILLSARAGDEARVEGIELGADDYLVKPFNAHELVARVRTHLDLARLRKEAIEAIRQSEERVKADLEGMRLLHELGLECARAASDFPACLHRIVQTAISIAGAEKGNLQLLDPTTGALKLAAKQSFDPAFQEYFAEVKGLDAACGRALRLHHRVVVEDITQSEIFRGNQSLEVLLAAGVRAVQSTPLISTGGEVLGMVSTHFAQPHCPEERELRLLDLLARQAADYIERKQAEEALRLRTQQFQSLLDNAPLGVYLVDSDFRVRQVNPIAVPVFDSIPDLVGRDFGEVMHHLWTKEYADEVVRIFRHTLATGEPYHTPERAEFRIDRRVMTYYEWRVDRIPLPEGGFGVVCYFRDISEQVQARTALDEQEERLRKT